MDNSEKQEIQAQFLDEAQDYLNTMESSLLSFATSNVKPEIIDQILRAAHSIKGGAAMMGFQSFSEVAHRLEDFLKIIKTGRVSFNNELERLFLASVDFLREIIIFYRQGRNVENSWLENNIQPVFTNLQKFLGDLTTEDEEALLRINNQTGEQDMSIFLFETEVENCLNELEEMTGNVNTSTLKEELERITQDLKGLGEMLELPAFCDLCTSIEQNLQKNSVQIETVAQAAIEQLRLSQALVLTNQSHLIPNEIIVEPNLVSNTNSDLNLDLNLDLTNIVEEDLEWLDFSESDQLETVLPPTESAENVLDLLPSLEVLSEIGIDREETQEVNTSTSFNERLVSSYIKESKEESLLESPENTIRVSARQIEELGDLFGELTIERNGLDLQIKNLRNILTYLRQKVQTLEKSNFELRTFYDQISITSVKTPKLNKSINSNNSAFSGSQSFDLLEMDHYSDLHLISGNIMETVVQIQEATNDFEIYLSDAEKLNRELTRTSKLMQTNLTQMSMRPFSDLLKRFPRALRDMELIYGKQVKLVTKGGSTLLEKSVLETLSDPLLHLLRNAFDHGIEKPEIRKQLGKPEKGVIEISANYRGNRTVISIRDDGKGINLDKIREKGKKMGLEEEDLAQASEKELLDLIFEPGFSTSEQITDLSGRGVGMNVVRNNVEEVKGEIMVETQPGVGTTFTLSVPFSLSVVRVLLVESKNILLAFPSNAVEEINLFNPEIIVKNEDKEFLNWEEVMIRLIRLEKYLNFAYSVSTLETEAIPIISEPTVLIIEQSNDVIAIQVDRYWGEQEVTIRQVEGNLKMPPGFTGCTILGDGRVVPLIDALELVNWIDGQNISVNSSSSLAKNLITNYSKITHNINSENSLSQNPRSSIMIIDDSINVRRFLALTLNNANYHVEQAKDGQDALEKLKSGVSVEGIICDIEMPRLDGYGFLANVKSNPNFKKIPVVMLTSRSGEKHRKMAMNLGANAYFSKPFKEKELLAQIKTLVR